MIGSLALASQLNASDIALRMGNVTLCSNSDLNDFVTHDQRSASKYERDRSSHSKREKMIVNAENRRLLRGEMKGMVPLAPLNTTHYPSLAYLSCVRLMASV